MIKAINDYVIEPALQATKSEGVLPFVICIGKPISELCDVLGLKPVLNAKWDNESPIEGWPDDNNNRAVNRTYQLYEKNGMYLLNTYAPGSNKPPCADTFQQEVEPKIIAKLKDIIESRKK